MVRGFDDRVFGEHLVDLAQVGDQAGSLNAKRELQTIAAFEAQSWLEPVGLRSHMCEAHGKVGSCLRDQLAPQFSVFPQTEAPQALAIGHGVAVYAGLRAQRPPGDLLDLVVVHHTHGEVDTERPVDAAVPHQPPALVERDDVDYFVDYYEHRG